MVIVLYCCYVRFGVVFSEKINQHVDAVTANNDDDSDDSVFLMLETYGMKLIELLQKLFCWPVLPCVATAVHFLRKYFRLLYSHSLHNS